VRPQTALGPLGQDEAPRTLASVREARRLRHLRIGALGHAELDALARDFAAAQPFPHVVIPDMLAAAPADVLPNFPPLDAPCWRHLGEAYQDGKMTLSNIADIAEPLASILRELMEPAGLRFVERVSGIRGLVADPYLQGAGLHCTAAGGSMAPHTDSHLNERLGIYRRVNVLLYLNPTWDEADGGCLELYDTSDVHTPVRTVVPRWGTLVLFRSDARSVHGFAKPIVGPGRARRSLAVYYYTAADAPDFAGYALTHWWTHDPYWGRYGGSALRRRARLQVYRALRFGSKALAYLAHRARPRALP